MLLEHQETALSVTNAYAGVFNNSATPTAPIITTTAEDILRLAREEMEQEPTFTRQAFVETPVV